MKKRTTLAATLLIGLGAACGWGRADQGVCPEYLACADASGAGSATLDATYGEDGTCWSGDKEEAQLCRANCTDLLAAAAELRPDLAECEPPDTGEPGDPARVDLLVLVDSSSSMTEAGGAFALSFDALFEELGDDVQATVATLDAAQPISASVSGNAEDLRRDVLCEATCFLDDPPSDPGYSCGEPTDEVTEDYLDCECGAGAWKDHCGTGTEEGLEAALLAMCRAAEEPPDVCDGADAGSAPGFLRDGATLVVLLVSDEGDSSRGIDLGNPSPGFYVDAYEAFGREYVWNVVGPDTEACNSAGATTWGVARYEELADSTGGVYAGIRSGSDCELVDFEAVFADIAAAL